MSFVGVLILAAGGSRRLGQPKQRLNYKGKSLLRRAAETALASESRPVAVVLGAHREELEAELKGLDVQIVENPQWETGMASSIRAGLQALLKQEFNTPVVSLEALIIMLCDQPLLSVSLLNQLIAAYRSDGKTLAACEYGETLGVPALFARRFFPQLLALDANKGAKQILQQYATEVQRIPFPGGEWDIDTKLDYERLKRRTNP